MMKKMGMVLRSSDSPLSSSSFSASVLPSPKPYPLSPVSISRFPIKPIAMLSQSLSALPFYKPFTTNASTDVTDAVSATDDEDDDDHFLFYNLPLDPKLQQKLEHKMRMKFSKNVRLRTKKLDRKRRMRKKAHNPKGV